MKYILIFIFIFIANCSGNKVTNYHGVKHLESKINKIEVNITNKNDLIKLIGQPSTRSNFNNNKWYYIERLKTNQSLFKLGTQKIKKNNILIVEMDSKGILISKRLLNLNDMKDIKYFSQTTQKEFENNTLLYNVFTTLREKINSPVRNKKK